MAATGTSGAHGHWPRVPEGGLKVCHQCRWDALACGGMAPCSTCKGKGIRCSNTLHLQLLIPLPVEAAAAARAASGRAAPPAPAPTQNTPAARGAPPSGAERASTPHTPVASLAALLGPLPGASGAGSNAPLLPLVAPLPSSKEAASPAASTAAAGSSDSDEAPAAPAEHYLLSDMRVAGLQRCHVGPPVRFSEGLLARGGARRGVDVRALTRRIMLLFTSGSLPLLDRAARAAGGRLPLNLLRPVAPFAEAHLDAMLAACASPALPRRQLSEYVFDGVHLTLTGLAAAAVALDAGGQTAVAPEGASLLTAPACSDANAAEGGGHPATVNPHSTRAPLWALFTRWPHLHRLLHTASRSALEGAAALLQAQETGVDADVPDALLHLFHEHVNALPVAASVRVLRSDGIRWAYVGLNAAMCALTGLSAKTLRGALAADPDAHPAAALRYMHPAGLLRRALAGLGAAAAGLTAYQTEVLLMRRVAAAAPGGQGAPPPSFVPAFALCSTHTERFPGSGGVRVEVNYFSDAVFSRMPVKLQELQPAAAHLVALQALLTEEGQSPTAARALGALPQGARLQALLDALDQESRDALCMRLWALVRHGRDALLATAGADTPPPPALAGVDVHRLPALLDAVERYVGKVSLTHLAEAAEEVAAYAAGEAQLGAGEEVAVFGWPAAGLHALLGRLAPPQ